MWRAVILIVLAGCALTTRQVDLGAGPGLNGPTLVLEVVNRSGTERVAGYEFEAEANGGAGEGLVGACEHASFEFGTVRGEFRVTVGGDVVAEASVEPQAGFIVQRVEIGPDGSVAEPGEPRWTATAPRRFAGAVEGCVAGR